MNSIGGHRRAWLPYLALTGAAVYLYLNLFAFPCTPFLLGGDQVYFWMYAQRLLHGERIYADFFQFTPPGTDFVFAALFWLFGQRPWVTNTVVLLLGVALGILCFSIARLFLHRGPALLSAALFLVLLYAKPLNATHHWFSLLAVMCAVLVAITKTGVRSLLATGALLGVASFFTQTRGLVALAAFLAFHLWEHARAPWKDALRNMLANQALLVLGFAAALLLLSAPFLTSAGPAHLWYFQFTYVRQYLAHGMDHLPLGLPEPMTWRTLPRLSQYLVFYALPLVVYPVTLWQCWRARRDPAPIWRNLSLLSLIGLFLFVEAVLSLNWLRLFAASMPAVILLLWIISRATSICRCVFTALWIAASIIALAGTVSRQVHQPAIAHLPGGTVATTPETAAKLQWIAQHTQPGEFFFQAGWPGVYLPLELRNPAYVDVILPASQTRPEDIASTIQLLDQERVNFVLWPARLDRQALGSTDNVTPLRSWLHSHYTPIHTFPDGDAIWQRSN